MTEHEERLPDENDSETTHLFDLLRQVEPTLEARVNFRSTVANELARIQSTPLCQPKTWWKRSISIPLPVALGLSVLLMAGIWINHNQWKQELARDVVKPPLRDSVDRVISEPNDSLPEKSEQPTLELFVSNTYLCGVGPLRTETRYVFQEPGK